MTRDRAIELMKQGYKITHTSFTPDEYIEYQNGNFIEENGYNFNSGIRIRKGGNWDTGWSIYEDSEVPGFDAGYDPKHDLPEDKEYVLAYFPDRPWEGPENNKHKLVVVQFIKGISKEERTQLPSCCIRKTSYRSGDEYSNNLVPYAWEPFGPGSFFGQECTKWWYLPEI